MYKFDRITYKAICAGVRWMPVTRQPVKDTKLKLTDLLEDVPYSFRVRAENREGQGEPSPASEQVLCSTRIGEWQLFSQCTLCKETPNEGDEKYLCLPSMCQSICYANITFLSNSRFSFGTLSVTMLFLYNYNESKNCNLFLT